MKLLILKAKICVSDIMIKIFIIIGCVCEQLTVRFAVADSRKQRLTSAIDTIALTGEEWVKLYGVCRWPT